LYKTTTNKTANIKMFINYKNDKLEITHLNLSTASFKPILYLMCFKLVIYVHFNICRFTTVAYTTLEVLYSILLPLVTGRCRQAATCRYCFLLSSQKSTFCPL